MITEFCNQRGGILDVVSIIIHWRSILVYVLSNGLGLVFETKSAIVGFYFDKQKLLHAVTITTVYPAPLFQKL